MKTIYRRYLVVAVDYEIEDPNHDEADIADQVSSELDYSVKFDGHVNGTPVQITNTEVIGFTDSRPLDC